MMLRTTLTAIAAVLLAGCATTPEQMARADAEEARSAAKLERALAGYTAGTPTSCITPRGLNTEVFGNTIVYGSGRGGTRYVTRTNGGCFGLKRDDIIVTRSFSGQLCSGDIVSTVDRTSRTPSGSCTFGEFVPYRRDRDRRD